MTRTLRISLIFLVSLILSAAVAWHWLLHTSSGASYLWSVAQGKIDGELGAVRVDGDLSSGLTITGLQFSGDGVHASADRVAVAVDLDLIPLSLTFKRFELRHADLQLAPNEKETNKQPPSIGELLSTLRLPVKINIEDLQIDDFGVTHADGTSSQIISSLSLQGRLKNDVVIDRLELVTPIGNASGDLSLQLQAPFSIVLNAAAEVNELLPNSLDVTHLTLALDGNSNSLEVELQNSEHEIRVTGSVTDVFNEKGFDLTVQWPRSEWPQQFGITAIDSAEVTARLRGTPQAFAIQANAELELASAHLITLDMDGTGTPQGMLLNKVRIDGKRVEATVSGSLAWGESPSVQASAAFARLDLHGLLDGWPAEYPTSGGVDVDWQGQKIQVHNLVLAIDAANAQVQGFGEIDTHDGVVDGSLSWQNISWPLDAEAPAISSAVGEVTIAGKVESWSVDGRIELQPAGLPAGALLISGTGNKDSVDMVVADSKIFGGSVRGRGYFSWRDERPLAASLDCEALRIDWLLPEWPGDLSGSVELNGNLNPLTIDLDISGLNGRLRQQPVRGGGKLSLAPGVIEFRDFSIEHGGSSISLDGDPWSAAGVNYEFDLHDLQSYLNNAIGSVSGNGSVSLNSRKPYVRIDATGEDLEIGNIHIESISASDHSSGDQSFFDQTLTVSGLKIGDEVISELVISASGDASRHTLSGELRSDRGTIGLHATGGFLDPQKPQVWQWLGALEQLEFAAMDNMRFTLDRRVSVAASAEGLSLESACLSGEQNEKLCVAGTWAGQSGFDGTFNFVNFSADIPMAMAGSQIELTQTLSGDFQIGRNAGGALSSLASVEISPGQIRSRTESDLATDTGTGSIAFVIQNNKRGTGHFDLPIPGLGAIDIEFGVNDVARGLDGDLSGRAKIELADIGLLAHVLPLVDSAVGRLKTDIVLSGKVSNPVLTGSLSLNDVAIGSARTGTYLSDVDIEAEFRDNNRLELAGSFRAGDGIGTITSSVDYDVRSSAGLDIELRGNNLTLVNMSDLKIVANPDLRIGLRDRVLQLDGVLEIPEAMIMPGIMPELQISESEDVIIIAGELPGREQNTKTDQELKINGTLRVDLGSKVRIDVGVAKANLGGSVEFEWQDKNMPIGRGTYTIDGTIAAVGQLLEISQGTIRFPSVPANNPFLNIRAERQIFGNSQIRVAGVMLSGAAENPVMEAYTVPMTTEERALTLLATGSDFDFENGVGAIDFGTYIAPKLFLSYGVGVFERENVISARYDLKNGFGIKATSGQRESGLDVNYRIEN